jgi:ATP-dependent helicase IRC3
VPIAVYSHVDPGPATIAGRNRRTADDNASVNFRTNKSPLSGKPDTFPQVDPPAREKARESEEWETFLRRSVNLFYQCAAVAEVEVGARGPGLRTWRIKLFGDNDPRWLDSHVTALVARIQAAREKAGYTPAPDSIEVG